MTHEPIMTDGRAVAAKIKSKRADQYYRLTGIYDRMLELKSTGHTGEEIAQILNDEGRVTFERETPFNQPTVSRILKRMKAREQQEQQKIKSA